ncbi:MAG: hypothetical protein IJN25_08515 [Clostridia bacterium]|nr:hypothetical protein [Clostridia bacterium]
MKNAKKFLSLAMVLMMVLSLAPTAVYADNTGNLLTNGGFEEELKTEWEYASNQSKYSSTLNENAFIVTAPVHSGGKALQLVTDGTGRWLSQKVEGLTPGKAYRASVWVNIEGTLTDGLFLGVAKTKTEADAGCMAASNGVNRGAGRLLTTTGGVWKNLDCAFVPSVEKNTDGEVTYDATFAYIILEFGANEALTGTSAVSVYIDDVVLEEIPAINGSFEDTEYTVSGDATSTVWAKGWSTIGAGDTQYETTIGIHTFVAANAGRDGTNALCLTTTEDPASDGKYRQLHAYVPVTGLEPGRAYRMRCYTKTSLTGSETKVSLNVVKNDSLYNKLHGSWAGKNMVNYKSDTATTEWGARTFVFTAEDTYAFIGLAARAVKGEIIYFDDVTIEETNIKFTAEDGTVLGENFSATGTVNAKATVVGAAGDVARMIVGVYDTVSGTPCLEKVYISESTTLTSAWKEITIENISLSAGQYAKAVLLDSAAGLKPLTEAKQLTVESAS